MQKITTRCSPFILVSIAFFCFHTSALISKPVSATKRQTTPKITIIIDDVGDNQQLSYRAAKLPQNVALSILPHTPFSKEIAVIAHNRGMDIMLHQPMESVANNELLGPGALLSEMDKRQFMSTLDNNLEDIPFVVGVNNHMGSLLTTNDEKMNWLMDELSKKALFFIDSRTTTKTVAAKIAENWQVPTMSRKVFLDHYDDPIEIDNQFQRLLKIANKQGYAIAIGHPKINTLNYLEKKLPTLNSLGIQLVSLTEVMATQFILRQKKQTITQCDNEPYTPFIPFDTLDPSRNSIDETMICR